ncbi:probable Haloacid dehalogenase, type II [Fulvimarina pelagi HTCC2506]|uniref:(S)-2-haloacid dehalogenase n=2 Tax=Fulvimarina pelagi TaxID=217511 RepID=Q0G1L6_9HYPH|nr:haloacid dehalogenase type II [Fulvimarina pelagi]EAU41065.1 probable Haloacid dehalogenase, type II [Fulvimarina pelagi HTCC2506]BAT30921.1 probable haloacid dehalogenase, type II [Fulvimarina pelagi]
MANQRPKAIIFDIIETIFALETVRPELVRLGLQASDLETWFAFGLRDAFTLNATRAVKPFPEILKGALAQLLAKRELDPPVEDRERVFEAMRNMSAHDDAAEALAILRDANLPVYALSNGARASTQSLLDNAGLTHFFTDLLSVESIDQFKPSKPVYDHGVAATGQRAADVMLVATHAWDCHGAKMAGMQAAFVARGQVYPDVMVAPDLTGVELLDVAHSIVNLNAPAER